jgi:hypothetical protein
MDSCKNQLKKLTGKKYIIFTRRCNDSIKLALQIVKNKGFSKILTQDQGGWLTYTQFIEKLNLEEIRIKTNHGIIQQLPKGEVLLLHSSPGYYALQEMNFKDIFIINDVCGSIGTSSAKVGDLIVGSFGKWKPINLGNGGFIATDDLMMYDFLKDLEVDLDFKLLNEKILSLANKLKFYKKHSDKAKFDLKDFEILKGEGINVIVKFSSEDEKEKLINYCDQNNYEFVECPKYIRVLDQAISIEIKRLG